MNNKIILKALKHNATFRPSLTSGHYQVKRKQRILTGSTNTRKNNRSIILKKEKSHIKICYELNKVFHTNGIT